ncbi:MAG: hypothetical protein H6739_31360 [Alphaproteobacteria bacterium]|nr:hypothetical protein [Alphaproteobacteria bacterium]
MNRALARLLLAAAALLAALGSAEAWVRLGDRDLRELDRLVYLQAVDLPLHQAVDDPVLHYTLRPGARTDGVGPYGPFSVSVNRHGARGSAEEPPDVMVFGASTVYGVGVGDDETLPAALGRHLSARAGRPVRVWNFGTSAYVAAQMIRLARQQLAVHRPARIVIVHTNLGRRPFLAGQDPAPAFQADPRHWIENLPLPDDAPSWAWRLHGALMPRSALVRFWATRALSPEPPGPEDNPIAAAIAREEAARLTAEASAAGVAVTWVIYPNGPRPPPIPAWLAERAPLDLRTPALPPEALDLHPAPAWLDQHAATLAEALGDTAP